MSNKTCHIKFARVDGAQMMLKVKNLNILLVMSMNHQSIFWVDKDSHSLMSYYIVMLFQIKFCASREVIQIFISRIKSWAWAYSWEFILNFWPIFCPDILIKYIIKEKVWTPRGYSMSYAPYVRQWRWRYVKRSALRSWGLSINHIVYTQRT